MISLNFFGATNNRYPFLQKYTKQKAATGGFIKGAYFLILRAATGALWESPGALSYILAAISGPLARKAKRLLVALPGQKRNPPLKKSFNGFMAGLGTDDRRSAQPLAPELAISFCSITPTLLQLQLFTRIYAHGSRIPT